MGLWITYLRMLIWRIAAIVLTILAVPSLRAGMTVYDLNDVVRLRLQEISFFAVMLAVSGLIVRVLWNVIARSVPALPKLPYKQAMALTLVLSLGVMLVLTMISGARELLTPGAWRRQGSAYKLNAPENESVRLRNMVALKTALLDYAERNGGKFPPHDWGPEIPQKIWEADLSGTHFIYFVGKATNLKGALIAAEPLNFGESRYVLTASREIEKWTAQAIANALHTQAREGGGPP